MSHLKINRTVMYIYIYIYINVTYRGLVEGLIKYSTPCFGTTLVLSAGFNFTYFTNTLEVRYFQTARPVGDSLQHCINCILQLL
jgi:hypothetical protein